MHYFLTSLSIAVLAGSWWTARIPLLVPSVYAACSLVAILAYGWDKSAAQRGTRRIPETNLHLLGLLGGWPGALLAQQWFRHKTSKRSFRIGFWFTVLANSALLLWLHTGQGARHMNETVFGMEAWLLASPVSGTLLQVLLQLLSYRS